MKFQKSIIFYLLCKYRKYKICKNIFFIALIIKKKKKNKLIKISLNFSKY